MTRVSNQTNNLDPTSVNSRVFVGNLNTYLVGKEDLEVLFARYGRVIAISMHKGFAFVQFTDSYDARNAVLGEDGRTVAGQVIDVNMVSEPKPHQQTRKRIGSPRDSVELMPERPAPASNIAGPPSPALVLTPPTCKRARTTSLAPCTPLETVLIMHGTFNGSPRIKTKPQRAPTPAMPLICNDADVLVCGVCKQLFSCLQGLLDHKRRPCRLRFTCRCQDIGGDAPVNAPSTPQCAVCDAQCDTWWDLAFHSEEAHGVVIYRHNEETEQTQKSQCSEPASPSPADTANEQPMSMLSDASSLAETTENEIKINETEDEICNGSSSFLETSDSEEDHSELSSHALDTSTDKCVDTKDLQVV